MFFPPLSLRILESLNKQHGRAACTAQRCGCITRVSPQLNLTHLVHRRRESHDAVCCVSPLNRAGWPAERDAGKERGGNATLSWHRSGSRRPSLGMTPPHLSLQISSLSCFFYFLLFRGSRHKKEDESPRAKGNIKPADLDTPEQTIQLELETNRCVLKCRSIRLFLALNLRQLRKITSKVLF